jgi:hypothetical protein
MEEQAGALNRSSHGLDLGGRGVGASCGCGSLEDLRESLRRAHDPGDTRGLTQMEDARVDGDLGDYGRALIDEDEGIMPVG